MSFPYDNCDTCGWLYCKGSRCTLPGVTDQPSYLGRGDNPRMCRKHLTGMRRWSSSQDSDHGSVRITDSDGWSDEIH